VAVYVAFTDIDAAMTVSSATVMNVGESPSRAVTFLHDVIRLFAATVAEAISDTRFG
jgi:hypothetical protein